MGARKNGRARGRHAKGAPSALARLPLVRLFFLAPATQASKPYGFLSLSLWYDFLLFILLIKKRFTSFVPRISPSSLLHLPRTKSSCGVSLPGGGGRDSHVKMKGILVVSLWVRICRALFHLGCSGIRTESQYFCPERYRFGLCVKKFLNKCRHTVLEWGII